MTAATLGRVRRAPHPVLLELLYDPQLADDRQHVLPHLLRVDAAHIVMLAHCGLLRRGTAAALLQINADLVARLSSQEELFADRHPHRGLYLLYERHYIERLGQEIGGAAHLARSRNDIVSTITRLRLRDALLGLLDQYAELARTIVRAAEANVETMLPGFTHGEPAQPSTLAHYLCGVAFELLRAIDWLVGTLESINRSPMGAAAGFGTAFPIDREEVAELLGFSAPIDNACDAIASRDYMIYVLAALSAAGTTISRLSLDLQTWGGSAYGFFSWPDDLVSTSSIMPQKRNLFAFENVRGLAVRPIGALVTTVTGAKNTPFSNNIEVNAELAVGLWPALEAGAKAARLVSLLVSTLRPEPEAVRGFIARGQITMTAVADVLVACAGLPFRTAHDVAACALRHVEADAPLEPRRLQQALEAAAEQLDGVYLTIDIEVLRRALDPEQVVRSACFGGGPSPISVRPQVARLAERVSRLTNHLDCWRARIERARGSLDNAIAALRA